MSKITLNKDYRRVESEKFMTSFEEVMTFDKFVDFLKQQAKSNDNLFWKLRDQEHGKDDLKLVAYTFTGNKELAILKALKLSEEILSSSWKELLENELVDAIPEYIEEFFEKCDQHTLGNLQTYLVDRILKMMTSSSSSLWIESSSSPVLL